jgi:glutathione synthase/RimK-type ligase-like ATP-grasp enzyme
VKLILANNQSEKFQQFYKDLSTHVTDGLEYAGYDSLLFTFTGGLDVYSVATKSSLKKYDGVYVNGYMSTYELAAATALACKALGVPFVNAELADAPSMTKLTEYIKLAAAGVTLPRTIAGTKTALSSLPAESFADMFPAVLKRADADRGIDNFKVQSYDELTSLLENADRRSIWLMQEFVPNDGYYVVTFYDHKPELCIYRSLEERPDGNAQKAHMYKPLGGKNASLVPVADLPPTLVEQTTKAIKAMNRQIGSVDCLYDAATDTANILEVNYNPQMVTIDTFKQERIDAYAKFLNAEW